MQGKDLAGVKIVVKKLALYSGAPAAQHHPDRAAPGIRIGTDIQHTSTNHLRKYSHF
jgi:hypothetical protein